MSPLEGVAEDATKRSDSWLKRGEGFPLFFFAFLFFFVLRLRFIFSIIKVNNILFFWRLIVEATISVEEKLIGVLEEESQLLDDILSLQGAVRLCVKKRKWNELEKNLSELQAKGDRFSELDLMREELSAGKNLYTDSNIAVCSNAVRSKLVKSKIENQVLNEYVSTTRKFLQRVFDDALPESRNKIYDRYGRIVKNEASSLILNQVI